jgi:hypothetical protein
LPKAGRAIVLSCNPLRDALGVESVERTPLSSCLTLNHHLVTKVTAFVVVKINKLLMCSHKQSWWSDSGGGGILK